MSNGMTCDYDIAEEQIAWCRRVRCRGVPAFTPACVIEAVEQPVPDKPTWHDAFNAVVAARRDMREPLVIEVLPFVEVAA